MLVVNSSGDRARRVRGIGGQARGLRQQIGRCSKARGDAWAEALEPRVMLALVEWDGGAGTDSWHDAMNWSGDAVPTAVDDVVIGGESGRVNISQIAEAGSLVLGGELAVRGSLIVSGLVEVNGLLQLGRDGGMGVLVRNGAESMSIGGTGRVALGVASTSLMGRISGVGGGTMTFAPDLIVGGFGEIWTDGEMNIAGTIRADEANRSLVITSGGALVHSGRLESPGGSLYATSPSIRIEGGIFDSRGGIIGIGGIHAVIENTGRTIRLDAETGDLHFAGTIRGGELATSDGARFILQGNGNGGTWATLVGVHVSGDLHVRGATLLVHEGMRLDGRITLGDGVPGVDGTHQGWGRLGFAGEGVQTVEGSGEIVFDHHPGVYIHTASTWIAVAAGASVHIREGITLRGGGGIVRVDAGAAFRHDGTVIADVADRAIGLLMLSETSGMVFTGELRASAGWLGFIGVQGAVVLDGVATFASGTGVVQLGGQVDLLTSTLTVHGLLALRGVTVGGTIVQGPGGGALTFESSSQGVTATLRSVHIQIPVSVVNNCTLYIEDGVQLNDTMTIGSSSPTSLGHVVFKSTPQQALIGTGEVIFGATTGYSTLGAQGSAVDIASGITIRGGTGRLITTNGGSITHYGAIDAAVAGTTIRLEGDITHHGDMRIAASARIERIGGWAMQEGSTLHVEIAGTANSQMGRFTSTGAIMLNGAIEVSYVDGFIPERGQSFRFVSSVGTSGGFDTVTTPPLSDPDLKSPVLIDPHGVRLIVTHIADFNNDLTVNEADVFAFLTDWFAGGGDFDGDGTRTVTDIFVYLSAWFRA